MKLRSVISVLLGSSFAWSSLLGEETVLATAPALFELKQGTEANPSMLPFLDELNAWDLAGTESERLYYSNPTDGTIRYVTGAPKQPQVTILLDRQDAVFHGIELDRKKERLYFLDSASDTVESISLSGGKPAVHVQKAGLVRPNDLILDKEHGVLLVTDSGADQVFVFTRTGNQLASTALPGAWGIAQHSSSQRIFVTSYDEGSLYEVDLQLDVVPAILNLTRITKELEGPRGLAFDRSGTLFCLEAGADRISSIDVQSGDITHTPYQEPRNGRALLIYDSEDQDHDYIPDHWERRFLSSGESIHELTPGQDEEEDGLTLMMEYVFNGAPFVVDKPPVQVSYDANTGKTLVRFDGLSYGHDYVAEVTNDLVQVPWRASLLNTKLGDPIDHVYSEWKIELSPEQEGFPADSPLYLRIHARPSPQ